MITRFLAKLVIGMAVFGVVAFELASPLVVRFQLDSVANDAADEAAFTLQRSGDAAQSQSTAAQIVSSRNATLRSFRADAGRVDLAVAREAPSLLLKKWDRMETWYDVVVTVSAARKEG